MPLNELFAPNNHSAFEISFRPAEAEFCRTLAAALKEQYPLRTVVEKRIMQVNEAEQASNNFRVEAVGENGEARVLLVRKHILLSSEEAVSFLETSLAFLREQNIPVPQLVAMRSGALHCMFGGYWWQVFVFIEGNHYSGQKEELVSAAKGVAALHRALARFPYQDELNRRKAASQKFSHALLEKLLETAARNQDDIDALFIEHATILRDLSALRDSFGEGAARVQVIHGDLHPHNTIFSSGELRVFIDFDMMKQSELLREVGFAAHRFARQYAVHEGGGAAAAVSGFRQFIQTYRAENSVTDEEMSCLPRYMLDELLRRIVTDFSRYYFEGITRYANAKELEKKITLLREAEYLSRYAIS